ncbi:hypothetical protein JAAARDRAFT_49471 [Jaapia argillacea MUCL 33604]|uniref:Uncharacterized protein n=1 Tax=Jaapia argillacea MUCL 33604 TaxID=933084 RepID=A0A067PJY5_9AGAM|nr:hypothetical protein JAAARDRAFT_49471 [Jaapia argillacea MUCL 33604]
MLCTLVTIPGNVIAMYHWSLDDVDARAVQLSFLLHNMTLGVFSIIVWANAPTFGLFVIVGKSIRATNPRLRAFGIAIFSFFLLYTFSVQMFKVVFFYRGAEPEWHTSVARIGDLPDSATSGCLHPQASQGTIPYMIYLIITTEQIISRNGVGSQSNVWTLGQTLAMLMLLSVIMDCSVAMWREVKGDWVGWFRSLSEIDALGLGDLTIPDNGAGS